MIDWWLPLIIQLDKRQPHRPSSSKPAKLSIRIDRASDQLSPTQVDMSLSSADLNLVTKCFGQMMADLVGVGNDDDDLGH